MNHNFSLAEKRKITSCLADYVTDHKQALIEKVLNQRTRHVSLVLEDLHKTHNASAVIRTAECLGVQDIHIIQNINTYTINPYVLRGALKWMSIDTYGEGNGSHSIECFSELKANGYKIVVTTLDPDAKEIDDIDLSDKMAVVFGTEHSGVSAEAVEFADEIVSIPMVGFTESLNVSVSAGIILQRILFALRDSAIDWKLSSIEKDELRFDWYSQILVHSDEIINNIVKVEGI